MNVVVFVAIRKLNGLTQYQFAEKLGMTRSLVAAIEAGTCSISSDVLRKVRRTYDAEYIEQVSMLATLAPAK